MSHSQNKEIFLKTLTILYVEDDAEARNQLGHFLERRIKTLFSAENGAAGLNVFQKEHPDIVITDIQMPVMDGLTMAHEIRKQDKTTPIIVITAFEQTDYLMRAINIGVDKYVAKPICTDQVMTAVLECARSLRSDRQVKLGAIVFNGTQEAIVITDPSNIIISVNPAFTQITGYTEEEAVGHTPKLIASGKQNRAFYHNMWRQIQAKGHWQGLLWNKRKDGTIFPSWLSISTLMDTHGRVAQRIGIFSDTSEQLHLEEQLRHAQKMDAIGQFAGGVAHDFNNILMVIIGYCDILKLSMKEDNPLHINVEQISLAAYRAATLTSSLLAFGRKQIMTPKTTDLNQLIADSSKFLRRVLGEDICFKTTFREKTINVCVDNGQVMQVMMNLTANARDAMEKGGLLSIETSVIDIDEAFVQTHGYGAPGKYALLSVSDTGRGMDDITRQKIFEPFFTTKKTGKGTGLGMSIVYGIIKQHNGYISVYSEPGKGTSFRLYFPVVAESPLSPEEALVLPIPGGSETILVVEDDPDVRKFEISILEKHGYTVIAAEDGQDAVAKFTVHQKDIALVITDIIMPQKSGRQAYDEIRKLRPDIKALFTSGYPVEIVRSRGEITPETEIIAKPVSAPELLRRIRELLDSKKDFSIS
jgi:two-component system NtrC family sensor kinase